MLRLLGIGALALGVLAGASALADEVCESGFQAYKNTLKPLLDGNCSYCHNGANSAAPPWAVGSDEEVYNRLKHYIRWGAIDQSALIERAGNNHCGLPTCTPDIGAQTAALAQDWFDQGEFQCILSAEHQTIPVQVAVIEDSQEYDQMELPFHQSPEGIHGLALQLSIRRKSGPNGGGVYQIRLPRLTSEDGVAIEIKGIRFALNNVHDTVSDAYATLNTEVVFFGENGHRRTIPLTNSTATIPIPSGGEPHMLTAFVEELLPKENAIVSCNEENVFARQIWAPMIVNGCDECHDSGNPDAPAAARFYDLREANPDSCLHTKLLSQGGDFSVMVKFASGSVSEHPALPEEVLMPFKADLINWLELENEGD